LKNWYIEQNTFHKIIWNVPYCIVSYCIVSQ